MPTTRSLLAAVAVIGAVLCGVAWGLSSPAGSSPDEQYHLTSIWCAGGTDSEHCSSAGLDAEGVSAVEVPGLVAGGSCYAFDNAVSGECQREVAPTVVTSTFDRGTYPPGFYKVMGLFVGDRVGESVIAMRTVNVLIAAGLFAGLAIVGTKATRRLQVYVLSAVLIPLGWFLIASVNPSAWAVIGLAAYGFGLHSLALVEGRVRTVANGVLALAGTGLALAARGDATVYVGLITGALAILHVTRLRSLGRRLVVPLLAVAAAAVMLLSASQVGSVAGAAVETDRSRVEVLLSLVLDSPVLISGMFGYGFGLGWLDTPMYPLTAFSTVLVLGFFALSGVGLGGRAKGVAVALYAGAIVAMPMLTLYRIRMIVGESVQPRYLYPLVPVLLLMLLTGPTADRGLLLRRGQAWVIFVMLSVAQAAALYANLRRYVTGFDNPTVFGSQEWWWASAPNPIVVWLVGSLGFVAFCATLVCLSRPESVLDQDGPPNEPTDEAPNENGRESAPVPG